MGKQRCVRGDDDDDRAPLAGHRITGRQEIGNLLTDGDAGDRESGARAIVALHEDTDRVPPTVRGEPPRRRADPALELVADHAGPAADVAFGHGTAPRAVERRERVLLRHVKAVDVVERAIPRLGDDRERPVEFESLAHEPFDHGIADDADAVRVGDHHGPGKKARLLEPGGTGHLAVAVEREPSAKNGIAVRGAAREDGGDAGAHRTAPDDQLAIARDDRAVPDGDTGDVGDGVEGTGRAVEGDAEIARAGARACLRGQVTGYEYQPEQNRWSAHALRHHGVRKQGLPHGGSCLPARVARLGERLHHRIAECARNVAPQLAEIRWGRVLLHIEHGGGARGGEWRPPGERLEHYDAQRVQIGSAVDIGRAARLLGTHVLLGANDESAARHPIFAGAGDRAGDPEVDENRATAFRREHDIVGFDVAMREPVIVGVAEGVEHFGGDPDGPVDGQRTIPAHHVSQRLSRHERHHEPEQIVGFARVEQRRDVRMVQLGGPANLAQEAISGDRDCQLGMQHLDRDFAAVLIERAV